jgi:hypothetical protein
MYDATLAETVTIRGDGGDGEVLSGSWTRPRC